MAIGSVAGAVFFSETATCFKCHTFAGEGEKIGPDLSNLPHRDYASVLRDIVEPSFAINPDYITHVISLADGRLLAGTVRKQGDKLLVADNEGKITTIGRSEIEKIQTSSQSIMPDDLAKKLGPEKLRDLLVFLLSEPPQMPDYGKDTPPPAAREMKEVQAILAGSSGSACQNAAHSCCADRRQEGSRPRRARLSRVAESLVQVAGDG